MSKKKMTFNIIKDDSTDGHGGFGVGTISLENVSPVFIDIEEEEAYIEVGAMHARGPTERGIKFTTDPKDSEGGKPYWLVWVTIEMTKQGPVYAGATACYMVVHREKRRGYKILADHVNNMDRSMKGRIIVDEMDDLSKRVFAQFLKEHNEDIWNNSPELQRALEA